MSLGIGSKNLSNWKFLSRHADHLMLDYRLILLVFVTPHRSPVESPGLAAARDRTWPCSARDFRSMKGAVMGKVVADSSVVWVDRLVVVVHKSEIAENKSGVEVDKSGVEADKLEVEADKSEVEAGKSVVEAGKSVVEVGKLAVEADKSEVAKDESVA